MNYKLPSLEEIVNRDFVVFKSKKEMISAADADAAFLIDQDVFYIIGFDPLKLSKSMMVDCDTPIEEVVKYVKKYRCLLVKDHAGSPIGFIDSGIVSDCLFNSFRCLRAFFDTVLETMDASCTVIDKDETVCAWTEGAEKIFSIPRDDIIGKPVTSFFEPDMLEILKTLKHGRKLHRHRHQPRPDLFVLINSNPVYLDGKIIGAVVSETDITSQVRLNQELFNMSTEVHRLEQEVARLRPSNDPFSTIKGRSRAIRKTIEMARKVSSAKSTVLILGESGVGKELFAKAIHDARETPNAPFIPINCGAIPASLFESELFGYERGAFSGADQRGKKGKIELARGGTLFLDEIGEMPMEMQVKLLRVLQEKKFYRIGGTKEIDADFRVIAATNRNLEDMVKEGKFREDLFYRLNVISINIPPLRERKEDLIELTHYFLYEFSIRYNRPIHGISQEVMNELFNYSWPGNVRELRNVIERLVVLAADGIIKIEDLPFVHQVDNHSVNIYNQFEETNADVDKILSLKEELEMCEKKIIERVLRIENGNKQACAKRLGVTRATLYNRMKKLGIKM
ncbi:PAS domain S-box-containing protein [Bacillus alveayuensis]|uniref:PAS domain S-box-containing protein n=2 Tax=Aeribacillus alveayuensis TaxID=279215 RepID=A0ABT9VQK4_9BACI|nr:PAS domain S-box-containing protein [Bacillus alveayuensis]